MEQPLVWIDLEMTGLNLEKDKIIEIAVIITDGNLKVRHNGPELIIQQSQGLMDSMDSWCRSHHGKSGLTDSVLKSKITIQEAEEEVMKFVKLHIPAAKQGLLAGNSVHVDRQFLIKEFPRLIEHLHYRILDVSTIKELAKRWYPEVQTPQKEMTHRALDDIKESIKELEFYRHSLFR